MAGLIALALLSSALTAGGSPQVDAQEYRIPQGFLIGAGSSAYQTEGAWDQDGKGMSELDYAVHAIPSFHIMGGAVADEAADAYHHVEDDIQLLKELKVNAYRFSISWPRILPNGYDTYINTAGVNHYKHLINELIKINVTPVVTLVHFDFPQNENFTANFLSRDMPKLFSDFARVAFREFGDQVKHWVTINEPDIFCKYLQVGFTSVRLNPYPPGVADNCYECIRNSLMAHGMAYQVYQNEFKYQQGQIGLSLIPTFARPNSTAYEDIQAADRYNSFNFGLYIDPLTNDTLDFIGLNIYYGATVANAKKQNKTGNASFRDSVVSDSDVTVVRQSAGGTGAFGNAFERIDGWAMRETLLWTRDHYPQIPVMITESGFEYETDTLHDPKRQVYFSTFLREMTRAMYEDDVKVLGYFAWSLIDGYEWSSGYNSKMGLARVDFDSPTRTRTLRESAAFFQKLMTDMVVPVVEDTTPSSAAAYSQTSTGILSVFCICVVLLVS